MKMQDEKHCHAGAEETLEALGSDRRGLSDEEARIRLERFGRGTLKEARRESLLRVFLRQLADPMVMALLCAAAVSAAVSIVSGESCSDSCIILAVVAINSVLGMVQESRAEAAISALRSLTPSYTTVLRGGERKRIPAEEAVPGDIIALEAGDAVPADARLLRADSLAADESVLTGESLPCEKNTARLPHTERETPVGDRKNMLHMGSCITAGSALAVVTATGMNTEMGHIAASLGTGSRDRTPLQKRLAALSRTLTVLVLAVCLAVFAFSVLSRRAEISAGDYTVLLDTFMLAVSLAVAAIPEGLAAVVTVVLSLGVTRMSKKGAIVRRLTAVETLGCTSAVCTDKTGTLTENRMTVVRAASPEPERLATALSLCTDASEHADGSIVGDPTQAALVAYASGLGLHKSELDARFPRTAVLPFDSARKLMTTVHRVPHGYTQYTTGAPDVVISRCDRILTPDGIRPMTSEQRDRALGEISALAGQGLRSIAAGMKWGRSGGSAESRDERGLVYLGAVGMEDPIRRGVPEALGLCRSAGMRVIMITGDHPATAFAIAQRLGIADSPSRVCLGSELDSLDDDGLSRAVGRYTVYSRVSPEHKTRIVTALRRAGCITAMTGDGVNDAPSLRAADIGVGMGRGGSDVVRGVADIILSDDNFPTLVDATREGRRIYDNICKAVQFLLSSNLSEIITIFTATALGFTVLSPAQILWINLITDTFPALALGLEEAEPDVMSRPPRSLDEKIIGAGEAVEILLQGALVSALVLAAYLGGCVGDFGSIAPQSSGTGMTMAFTCMAMAEIFHSCNMRSRHRSIFSLGTRNPTLALAVAASFVVTAAAVFIPPLRTLFGFAPVSLSQYLFSLALALAVIPAVELGKALRALLSHRRRRGVRRGASGDKDNTAKGMQQERSGSRLFEKDPAKTL